MLSLMSMVTRHTGARISANQVRKLDTKDMADFFDHPHTQLQATILLNNSTLFNQEAELLEKIALKDLQSTPIFEVLQTTPGIGKILAMTIAMETGPISRFDSAGNYASYSRCVKSSRLSNGKKKGQGNGKNGNKYLAWAWIEAANFHRRFHQPAEKYHQRKTAKRCAVVATKSLSAKLAKAGFYMMRDLNSFDSSKIFGS